MNPTNTDLHYLEALITQVAEGNVTLSAKFTQSIIDVFSKLFIDELLNDLGSTSDFVYESLVFGRMGLDQMNDLQLLQEIYEHCACFPDLITHTISLIVEEYTSIEITKWLQYATETN